MENIIFTLLLIALCGLVLAEKGLKYKDNVDLPGFELKEIEGQYRGNFVGFTNSTKTDILASISSVIRAKFFFSLCVRIMSIKYNIFIIYVK